MEATQKINSFEDLKTMGRVTKIIKLGAYSIKMHSLGYEEQSQILSNIPEGTKEARKYDIIQREILSASIESIDGIVLSGADKADLLGESQAAFVNLLFAQYELLLTEQNEIMDGVKKNISYLDPIR